MKRSPLKRRTPLKSGNRLRRASPKRQREYKEYTQVRNAYLTLHPICERCKKAKATDIHHKAGRVGKWLCLDQYFAAFCRSCHNDVHENGVLARKQGWIIDTFHALLGPDQADKALPQSQAHTPEQKDSKASPC
jgi:hypothetical protein